MSRIALVDYGMGNLMSVDKALRAAGAGRVDLTSNPSDVLSADKVVLPGVGHFGDGSRRLAETGLGQAVLDFIRRGKPFLGICLGMQLLVDDSEEAPGAAGLGVFRGSVRRLSPESGLKIPHIGWNSVDIPFKTPCLEGVESGTHFYFVHSFVVVPEDAALSAGTTDYGGVFCSCLASGNVFATQFHPEKSQGAGLAILRNFIGLI